MTDDEARAATAWAEKLGDETLMLSYQPSPVPMRLLLFDAIHTRARNPQSRKRRMVQNMITDPVAGDGQAASVMRAAAISRQVIFNVFSQRDISEEKGLGMSDVVFTVGLPDGRACGFLVRDNPFISAASMAAHSMLRSVGHGRVARSPDEDVRAMFWPKKKPPDRRACEMRVIAYVEGLLDTVAGF